MEFSTIEPPIELPGECWRRSLREMTDSFRSQIRRERSANKAARYDCDGRVWFANEMDDDEVEAVARSYAVRSVEAAINRHEESRRARGRDRKGIAR